MTLQQQVDEVLVDLYSQAYAGGATHQNVTRYVPEATDQILKIIDKALKVELSRLRFDSELELGWYLRFDCSESMNPQESGEANVAQAVVDYIDNRLAELSSNKDTKLGGE